MTFHQPPRCRCGIFDGHCLKPSKFCPNRHAKHGAKNNTEKEKKPKGDGSFSITVNGEERKYPDKVRTWKNPAFESDGE